jgi:hypothetical protein
LYLVTGPFALQSHTPDTLDNLPRLPPPISFAKSDVKQNRQAANQVSKEPGCRAPQPEDFETVHEMIKDLKGPNGLVTWEQLLNAWREVLCP